AHPGRAAVTRAGRRRRARRRRWRGRCSAGWGRTMTVRTATTEPMDIAAGSVDVIPTPPPDVAWKLEQRWENVLFCHFRSPKPSVQALVPAGLDVEERDGSAWVSVVPLHATHTHLNHMPELLLLSEFAEVNLRTYVRDRHGVPGVYFLSIDIHNLVFATAAREIFHVPYHDAEVTMRGDDMTLVTSDRDGEVHCEISYRPVGPALELPPRSLPELL